MTRRCKIVLITTVLAVASVVGALFVPRLLPSHITVTAHFADGVGLYVDNAVSVLGMPIGHVTKIEPRGGYVDVTLKIDKDVEIPADVSAVTVSASLLTDRHVELTPPYTGGPTLRDGDQIGLGNTRTPVEFDQTLATMDKLGTALRGDGDGGGPLGDLVAIGSQITSEDSDRIKSTLDSLAQALQVGPDGGAETQRSMSDILSGVGELTQSAATNDAAIRHFGSNVRQLSDILADQDLGSGDTGAKANELLQQVTDLLQRHRDELRETFTYASSITDTLAANQRGLKELLDVAPLAVDNVANVIDPAAGSLRVHLMIDKIVLNGQFAKEVCNLMGLKQLSCASGTLRDYGPDFGLSSVLDLMANGVTGAPR
ncbi:MCE family protein [Arthrobacter sp. SLBN-53]|uniref:MlaD family protein n=1 Tax=Arthrobacter sp. SLBN-53 TaxID=2768412 RepID=UPI00114E3AC7|nr:MCE family protein [Arthrobacter sp. SLBN-53]TQK32058.1 virulence factor Mce-like protein [Arthrobacter sp. SLBN-53]